MQYFQDTHMHSLCRPQAALTVRDADRLNYLRANSIFARRNLPPFSREKGSGNNLTAVSVTVEALRQKINWADLLKRWNKKKNKSACICTELITLERRDNVPC